MVRAGYKGSIRIVPILPINLNKRVIRGRWVIISGRTRLLISFVDPLKKSLAESTTHPLPGLSVPAIPWKDAAMTARSSLRVLQLLVTCGGLLAAAGGCTSCREYVHNGFKVGPNYKRPAAPVADEWIDSKNPRLIAGPTEYRNWWNVFNDPVLDRLIHTAYQQNITLREAGFRVMEARAQRNLAAGNLFPQSQQLFGDYTRTQLSTRTATFANIDPSIAGFSPVTSFSDWRLGSALSWELDFWGRYRRSIEAADARLDSSVENYDDALVVLISEVAATYVELRTTDERLRVARENADLQAESARVADERLKAAALNSEVDAPQAKSNLDRTLAAIEALKILRRQSENRLAVLMGMPPHDLAYLLEGIRPVPSAPKQIALDVPAELLRRRPDVRRAERLVAAQNAEIGVAQSNLYPSFSINGLAMQEAAQFGDLFKSGAFAGNIGTGFRWNVLNYGRLLSNVRIQDARFQQLVANYQETVLLANEEAENAIVAFLYFHEVIHSLEESVRNAREAVRVTQVKYREGEIDFNRVFTVEQLLTGQEDQLAVARGDLADSVVRLYRALGGGWELRLDPEMKKPVRLPEPSETLPEPNTEPLPPSGPALLQEQL